MTWSIFMFFLIHFCCYCNGYTLPALKASYHLARELSARADIDGSHNHEHSKEVLYWSTQIIKRLPFALTTTELFMVAHCSILHDLMDSKYEDFSVDIRDHLRQIFPARETEVMMDVMGTMSYSKIFNSTTQEVCFPDWISTLSPSVFMSPSYSTVFHITREADLMSSYNIARMIEYRLYNKRYRLCRGRSLHDDTLTRMEKDECIVRDVTALYNDRMDRLIERRMFVHPTTEDLARSVSQVAKLKLELLSEYSVSFFHDHLDILRIVNHLSIDRLIDTIGWIETIRDDDHH